METTKSDKYNGFTTKKGNHVWACALGLAWKQLMSQFVKEPITIDSNDKDAQQIVSKFNSCQFSTQDIDQKSYYIKAGYGEQTIKAINQECKKKFANKSFSDINAKPGPLDITAYAYLFKQLVYKTPLVRNQQNNFFFQGQSVASFMADSKQQKDQIFYSYYQNQDKFMVYITGADAKDTIYLIKDKQIQKTENAIKHVLEHEGSSYQHLKTIDEFQMPIVDIDIKHDVDQITGKAITNTNLNGYAFSLVQEAIKLKIDQKGAKVQNQGIIMMVGCAFSKQEPQPKLFYLNKQFWIVMKEYGKHPYLVVRINQPVQN